MKVYDQSTLARCDDTRYSSIYDVNDHPDLRKTSAASTTQPIQRDTLQISQDELKKDALKRLNHTSKYFIVQQGFMRIGKYLFLAVALPPYVVAYKIPKWIVVECLPWVVSFLKPIGQKIGLPVKRQVEIVIHKLIRMAQQIQAILSGIIQPIIGAMLGFNHMLQRMNRRTLHFFKGVGKRFAHSFSALKQAANRIIHPIQHRFGKAQQWLANQASHVWAPMRGALNWLRKKPKLSSLKIGARFSRIQGPWNAFQHQFQTRFQRAQQIANRATDWMAHKWGPVGRLLESSGHAIIHACQRYVYPPLKKMRQWMRTGSEFLKNKHEQFQNWIHKTKVKVQLLTTDDILDSLSAFPSLFWWVPQPIRRVLKFLFWNPFIQVLVHGILKGCSAGLHYVLMGLEWGVKGIGQICQFLGKAVKDGRHAMSILASKLFSYPALLLSFIRTGCRKVVYSMLVFLVMFGILLVWGMELLVSSPRYLDAYMPIFSRVNNRKLD